MKYPIIYDRLETEFTSHGLAILEKVKDPDIFQNLKGSYTFTFKMPNDEKAKYIQKRNYVKCDGQIFVIQRFSKIGNRKQFIEVFAEHVSYELIDFEKFSIDYIAKTYEYILKDILLGTPFTLVSNSFVQNNVTDFFYEPNNGIGHARGMLLKFINQIGAEIKWDNYTIEIVEKIGENNGVKLRHKKNIKGITEHTNGQTQCTRVIPIGKDGLDITSVNGGSPYLDAENIGDYKHPITNTVSFRDIDEPLKLKEKGQEYLDKHKYGNISIEVDFLELENHPLYREYAHLEKVALGDTVGIIYKPFDINDVPARIVSYSYNPIIKRNSKIILANYRAGNINDYLSKYENTSRTVDYAFQGKKLNSATLKGLTIVDTTRDVNSFEVSEYGEISINADVTLSPTSIIEWENIDAPSDLIYRPDLDADLYDLLDNSNLSTVLGEDYIVTGSIMANQIAAGEMSANRIRGGILSGVTLEVDTDAKVGDELKIGNDLGGTRRIKFDRDKNVYLEATDAGDFQIFSWQDIGITSDNISLDANFGNILMESTNFVSDIIDYVEIRSREDSIKLIADDIIKLSSREAIIEADNQIDIRIPSGDVIINNEKVITEADNVFTSYGDNYGFIDITDSGIVVRDKHGTVKGSIYYDR